MKKLVIPSYIVRVDESQRSEQLKRERSSSRPRMKAFLWCITNDVQQGFVNKLENHVEGCILHENMEQSYGVLMP